MDSPFFFFIKLWMEISFWLVIMFMLKHCTHINILYFKYLILHNFSRYFLQVNGNPIYHKISLFFKYNVVLLFWNLKRDRTISKNYLSVRKLCKLTTFLFIIINLPNYTTSYEPICLKFFHPNFCYFSSNEGRKLGLLTDPHPQYYASKRVNTNTSIF